ncbi:MAG: TasA family protein [Eubacteriales bacterium]|nr:TasA family protein [Eubacteriales bacterium]
MRKRVVVSMLVIALAAALLGGAAFAWFTDSDSAAANFTAGTIKLGKPVATGLEVTNMAPGDHQDWTVTIQNDGTLDMYYRLSFSGGIAGAALTEVLEVSLYDGTVEESEAPIFGPTLLSAVDANNFWFNEASMYIDASGAAHEYTIRFELPIETGNDYQGATWNITLNVQATQKANQDTTNVQW